MERFKARLKDWDPVCYEIMEHERQRQNQGIELIPSENFVSKPVLEAMGSVLTNKYAEGYPGKRYYGGNEFIDQAENLAIERCKKLFGCDHANVQPYSGSPGNFEVYVALLEFGDKVLAMNLAHGGHLTHGHKVNFSGKGWNFVPYGVDKETERINMDEVRELAQKEQPRMVLSGASAYPRKVEFKKFAEIAKEIGAISFADPSHISGLIVAGEHENPFPETDVVMTTTHKTLRGPRGAVIMCREDLAQKIDKAVFPGMQGGPHEHAILGKAVAFAEAGKPEFKDYARQIVKNAKAMAEALMDKGLRLVSGGTDNHLILCDLTPTGVTGKEAEEALDQAGITLNKNMVPFDSRSPFNPSGIRMGTPAITSRGFKADECKQIGEMIADLVLNVKDEGMAKKTRAKVLELTSQHPMYD